MINKNKNRIKCSDCKHDITKIVRVYENTEGETIRAFFETDGYKHVTYQYDSGGWPISNSEDTFMFMIKNQNWKLISERYLKNDS